MKGERPIRIEVSPDISLDARFTPGHKGTAIICHPHPVHGGHMDVNVVRDARNAAFESGLGTIRFDFRGVRRSSGTYGDGIGEMQDLRAVIDEATRLDPGPRAQRLHLMGYSFGAWISVRAVSEGFDCASLTLISPPLDLLDHPNISLPDNTPFLIVNGDRDEFCSLDILHQWKGHQSPVPQLEILADTDHYYIGHREPLTKALKTIFAD
ncbi:MAG: hypothetical protein HN348_07465 [Proteobacteria bacterium]|nr:hypothetical protein [Pseudomonadota bacterium]